MAEDEKLYLGFILSNGKSQDNKNIYELLFTTQPNELWGEKFEYKPCGIINNLLPSNEYISSSFKIKVDFTFSLIQDSDYFGMQDCMDQIISLAYAFSSSDKFILSLNFGEEINEVKSKLKKLNIEIC